MPPSAGTTPARVRTPRERYYRSAVRIALLLYALLVLAASLYPAPPQWAATAGRDHVAHFFAYLVLGALLTAGLPAGCSLWTVWWRCGAALLIGACYGAALEVAQQFTGRVPETGDALANLLGVAAGVAAGAVVVTVSRLRRRAG